MIPLVTSLAVISPRVGAVAVAFACSMAMSLPISTPPNAIAFATRAITTKELARYGSIVSVFGLVLILVIILIVQQFAGLS